MKINRVSLSNFLTFTENSVNGSFSEDFNEGINVLIGANATGKSTLLKCIYAACEFSNESSNSNKAKKFQDYFSASKSAIKDIIQMQSDSDFGVIQAVSGEHHFHYRAWDNTLISVNGWLSLGIKSVLIPSAEMLSHSKGLVAMSSKYGVPFDHTQMDILVNAQLWETKEISERNKLLLDKLGAAIDGEVIYENDTFYIVKSNGLKVEYSLEADGFKRIGLLWKLIRNGLLESGSILLWDEPESSVHPEFMYLIAEVLHILAQDGVQIFIATHSYAFAKYLDKMKKSDDDVLFISLYKEDNVVKSSTANSYSSLQNNAIEASEEKLYEAVVEDALEDM
jgi:predicted ATP-dependent endonuclease of OLD family